MPGAHSKPTKINRRSIAVTAAVAGGALAPITLAAPSRAATMAQWDRTAQLESGGDWSINHSSDGKSVGGLQFQTASWRIAVDFLRARGYNVSCYNLNLFQGMPRSSVPSKDQTILGGEALLDIQGPGAWANGNAAGSVSMFRGGPNPWGLPGTQAPASATCGAGSPAAAPPPLAPVVVNAPPTTPPPDPTTPPVVPDPPVVHHHHHHGQEITHTVAPGDWLSKLAQRYYGDWRRWPEIYNANRSVVGGNPDLILPGQQLVIPQHG